MRVAVLFSGGASALRYALERDFHLNVKYQFVGAFTNVKDASGIELARRAGIPMEIFDFREFLRARQPKYSDERVRQEYFANMGEKLAKWKPDLLILSGFMLILQEPMLGAFKSRILNVHPADLTVLDDQGRRKYIGMDAVEKAIRAGEKRTRSSIHLVTAEVDGGPIVWLSDPLPVELGTDAKTQQEKMKWACDGPAYCKALELIAEGRVWLEEETGHVEIR